MVRILVNRPTRRQTMVMYTSVGGQVSMHSTPPRFTYQDQPVFGTLEREGRKALTRKVSPGLRKLGFTHTVASLDWQRSLEHVIRRFTDAASNGWRVRFSGGSGSYEAPCWWYIKNLQVTVTQRGADNHPSRAELQWDLEEAVDVAVSVSVIPPPPPPRPPRPPAPRRTYVIVRGDTLWGIAARFLGNGARWPEIYALSRRTLRSGNPNLIFPGEVVRIP